MRFSEFRNAAIFLIAMADFWKDRDAEHKAAILNNETYRRLFFEHLADKAAQDAVWKAGYNYYSGGFHGYDVN